MAEHAFHQFLSSQLFFIFMRIENFITDALDKPNDYIAYHIGRELAKLSAIFI